MEEKVIITTDSTGDLPTELAEKYDIKVLPLMVVVGDESYLDGVTYTSADMHESCRATGIIPKTAAPSLQSLEDFFKPFLDAGYKVVHISVGATLSSNYNNIHIAADEAEGLYCVDTRSLSNGVALLAIEAAECRDMGMSAAEIVRHVEKLVDKLNVSFVLNTLDFIWKGGRCSAVSAMGANLLKLKPALEMKNEKLGVYKKYRGNIKNVYVQYIKERLKEVKIYKNRLFLISTEELDEETEKKVREAICLSEGNIVIERAYAGCCIFSHCGPGTLGIMFISE